MKELAKKYWIMAILIIAPLLRHFSENGTVEALAGLAVWSILWVLFAIVILLILMASACHFMPNDMKVEGFDKMTKPLYKMKWWKSALYMVPVLGTYIYVDWSGPAILYTLTTIGVLVGAALLRSGIVKVCEAQGIELPEDEDDKPDELKNLKKNPLEN